MELHNLRSVKPSGYTTWGCMWEKGLVQAKDGFCCKNRTGETVVMQSRITAYWPDGSVKWTAHTADSQLLGDGMTVEPIEAIHAKSTCEAIENGIRIIESDDELLLDTSKILIEIPKDGAYLFTQISKDEKLCACNGKPILYLEEPSEWNGNPIKVEKSYLTSATQVELEEQGALQCIVKFTGIHCNEKGDSKIPFIIRMRVNYASDELHFTHTFLYDGEEDKDYLKGLGVSFRQPMNGAIYNRHIKVTGDYGVFHESMVPLISWRPRVPEGINARQMNGEKLGLTGTDLEIVNKVLEDTPFWSEYDVCQDSVSHFSVRKKLAGDNLCYIDALHGNRTEGGLSFGSESGSVMVNIRDFWQKYPSGYTIKNLDGDMAECSIWLWSPSASVMDFRHYANRGYNQVCYEGYDYKAADPVGIACTNEFAMKFMEEMIPSDEDLITFTNAVNTPAIYVGTPEFYHRMKAFGYWSLPSHETQMEVWLEEQMNQAFEFYKMEVDQRNWYGMFNYGDFMHTYDNVRHQWRYDIGGYAWDNTELVPTLWLWYFFMRTGREDVFELAEKLSRHASEVDVYHMGQYKGLGSRHNVRHWGCPCKEARIAMAHHHRFFYYMTGDRRLEDIFEELKDNEISFLNRDPLHMAYTKDEMVYPTHARSGPDWSSLCSNWMTRWERFNDTAYRDKILVGLQDIKNAPLKLVSGPDFEFDPATFHLRYIGECTTGGTHLQICMGAPSIWMEMADLLEDEEWKEMIARYGRFYYLPNEQQQKESNGIIGNREFSLPFMSAAMGAYGAAYLKDEWLASKTWEILLQSMLKDGNHDGFTCECLNSVGNQKELMQIPWITTNFVAQWCLNVIMVLEFIKDALPKTLVEADELTEGDTKGRFHQA